MSDGTENENRRRIDKMQGDFEKSEIRREKDKQIQEEQMNTLRSNLGESLARNEAANQAANARLESKVDEHAKDTHETVANLHQTVADLHQTIANLHRTLMFAGFGIVATIGVGLAFLNTSLRSIGAGG